LYFNILDNPSYLNIQILPKELKEIVKNKLLKYYDIPKVEGIVNYMNARDRSNELDIFLEKTKIIDKSRDQDFFVLQSEFVKWI
jgi:hypothetical protein